MQSTRWPAGGGESGALMRSFDWHATPIGPIEQWPQSLRTLVELVLVNPAPSALLWGESGTLIYNDGYAAICGSRHPQVFGGPLRDAWPEAWDFNGSMLAGCRAGRPQVYQNAHFVLERDGCMRDCWFDLYYAPVGMNEDAHEGVLATVVEITERVIAERAREAQASELRSLNATLDAQRARLEIANQRLSGDMQFIRNLFQSSPSFIAVLIGPDHRFELTNAAYDQLIQNRNSHGKPVRQVLPEVAGQGFIDLLDRVYRSGEAFHGQNVEVVLDPASAGTAERRILDFTYQPLKNAEGLTYGILVEGIDITARALAEERLRASESRLQTVFSQASVGISETDPEGRFLRVNHALCRLLGRDAETLLGLTYRDVIHPDDVGESINATAAALAEGQASARDKRYLRPDGSVVWAHTGISRIVDSAGQPVAVIAVTTDLTERRLVEARLRDLNESLERTVSNEVRERLKAEGALRHAQKMEAVGQLASGIAHDFNNVLQIVSSNLQLIERDFAGSARQSERVAQALAAVTRGSRLSLQLLAFGRKQNLQPAVTDLGLLLEDLRPLLQRALGDGIAMSIEAEPGLWSVHVDRNQFENAILNIAINGRDAMQGKGCLRIAVDNRLGADGDPKVILSVSDSGCGMPDEVLSKVFDPFYTTKEAGKGTGLGMSMVYGFVSQSGGEIRIDSAVGVGTTIVIELPRKEGKHESGGKAVATSLERGHETILLVEDDPAVLTVTADMLAGLGYRTLTAADGAQAADILKSQAAVDLVFSDISMPGHVTAADLVHLAGELTPDTAILLTSGHVVDSALLDDSMPADVALLPKPYTLAQLAAALREHLTARAANQSGQTLAVPVPGEHEALRFLVVEDDPDSRALACEMIEALGCVAQGVGSAEQALALLVETAFDVLFTDLHLPGMSGDELAAQAGLLRPSLQVVLASGEGMVEMHAPACQALLLPKPYDLLQLQDMIGVLERVRDRAEPHAAPDNEPLPQIQ